MIEISVKNIININCNFNFYFKIGMSPLLWLSLLHQTQSGFHATSEQYC